MNQEEMEINLIDLLLYVCSKYRSIIAVALIFMVLGGGYGYNSQSKADAVDKETKIQLAADSIELTLDEEHLKDLYYSYKDMYELQKEKNLNNKALTADQNEVKRTVLTYMISDTYKSEMIARTYEAKLARTEENFGSMYDMTEISVVTPSTATYMSDTSEKMAPQAMLKVIVYGLNEEDCASNKELAKNVIDSAYVQISESVGNYLMILVNDDIEIAPIEVVRTYKNNEMQKEYSAYSALAGIKNAMPADVKNYITTMDDFEKEETHSIIMTAIKYMIVGAFAGAFIMACIYAVGYIVNKSIRVEDDIERIYGINVFGKYTSSMKKGLDKKIEKVRRRNIHLFDKEQTVDMIAAGINVHCNKEQIKSLYITGNCMGDSEKNLFEEVAKKVEGVSIIIGKPMLYFADALQESANTGNVILVEKAGESKYEEINQEIKKCQEHDINILGMVVVE